MSVPHQYVYRNTNAYCVRAGTEAYTQAVVWNTQTDYITQPNRGTIPLLGYLYKDPRIQYFQKNGSQLDLCGDGTIQTELYLNLLYHDDSTAVDT